MTSGSHLFTPGLSGIRGTEKPLYYTGYAGCHITAGIPVKFGTAHGGSRPEVGSAKCIDVYGSGGVSRPSRILGKSEHNIITPTLFLRP